jgi:peptidoglycan/xylan/chitin deacetylase (PgdA/CDA1 family)
VKRPRLVIIPTIDVEGTHGERPFEQLVLGKVDSAEAWGIAKIAATLARYDAAGTFFMDVYEHTFWGKDVWEEACVGLAEQGQDVQLHTHPGWRDDPRDSAWLRQLKRDKSFLSPQKDFMAKLSLAEQIEVLAHGCELLESWLGQRPLAHRSGGYAVNEDTITALCQLGFKVDSSQNRAERNSELDWSINGLASKRGILEVPVTLYDRCFVSFGPAVKGTFRRLKTAVESPAAELIAVARQALEVGLPLMNYFMHSYSLLRMDKYFKRIAPHPQRWAEFERFLAWAVEQPHVEVMPIAHYYESGLYRTHLALQGEDTIPRIANGPQLLVDLVRKVRYTLQ